MSKAKLVVEGEDVEVDMDLSHTTAQGIFKKASSKSLRFSTQFLRNALDIAEDMDVPTIGVRITGCQTPDGKTSHLVLIMSFSTDGRGMMIAHCSEDGD